MADYDDLDDVADPALIARLAAWFGEPAAPPPREAQQRSSEQAALLARLEDALDPDLADRITGAARRADAMLRFAGAPLSSVARPEIVSEKRSAAVVEVEALEYEQPEDIRRALRDDNTPQATLRDLFRPVIHYGPVVLRPIETGAAQALSDDPSAEARRAMRERTGSALPPLPTQLIAADQKELRELLAKPWEDSKPDEATRSSVVPDYDHFRWFGIEGAYDPDQ